MPQLSQLRTPGASSRAGACAPPMARRTVPERVPSLLSKYPSILDGLSRYHIQISLRQSSPPTKRHQVAFQDIGPRKLAITARVQAPFSPRFSPITQEEIVSTDPLVRAKLPSMPRISHQVLVADQSDSRVSGSEVKNDSHWNVSVVSFIAILNRCM